MMRVQKDNKGQPMIEWRQAAGVDGGWKRAWIQKKTERDKDWAGTGRYINVVRVRGPNTGPAGNATDFPVYNEKISDQQVLVAFVSAACAITGCELPEEA